MTSPSSPGVVRAGALAGALVLLAALACFAAMPSSAPARVTWRGIDGVRLGMSAAQVRAALGEPSTAREAHAPETRRYTYRRFKLEVLLHRERVVALQTRSRAERAPRGVRVGMSARKMRRRVRGESCSAAEGKRVCSVDRGSTVMEFVCRRGRVVVIGLSRL